MSPPAATYESSAEAEVSTSHTFVHLLIVATLKVLTVHRQIFVTDNLLRGRKAGGWWNDLYI